MWHAVSPNDVIFSSPPPRSIRLAPVSSSPRTPAAKRRHIPPVRSPRAGSANFTSKTPSWSRTGGPADFEMRPNQLTPERRLLASNPHFVFERIDLAANSSWYLEAERETWLLVLSGSAIAGSFEVAQGDGPLCAIGPRRDRCRCQRHVGLVAYTGGSPVSHLLQCLVRPAPFDSGRSKELHMPNPIIEAKPPAKNGRLETIK